MERKEAIFSSGAVVPGGGGRETWTVAVWLSSHRGRVNSKLTVCLAVGMATNFCVWEMIAFSAKLGEKRMPPGSWGGR